MSALIMSVGDACEEVGELRFNLLGQLTVVDDAGTRLPHTGPRLRVLLAALLIRANTLVPAETLAETVWDAQPPPAAAETIRSYIHRLRRALGPHGASRVVARNPGYLIQVEHLELDVLEFEDTCLEATSALRSGQWRVAADKASHALDLWQGEPLLDVPSQALRDEFVPRLEALRLQAHEDHAEAGLQLGEHKQLVARLAELARNHPLHERFHAQLMLSLHRAGRQAEALEAYQYARRALVEELGLEPGPELRALHERILAQDGGSPAGVHLRSGAAPVTVPRQLPAATRHFVGRSGELESLLGSATPRPGTAGTPAISAISGSAGIGKTALAVRFAHQIARRFPGGQLYVNLQGYDPTGRSVSPVDAIGRFLSALGVPVERIPADPEERSALLRTELADRRVLILLDNARDADHVRPFLPGNSNCLVLVTSRDQLADLVALDDATPITLGLLSTVEARALLVERLGPERVLTDEQAALELAGRCARLPLALNIVAARAALDPARPLREFAEELRDARRRLDILAVGGAAADVRAVFSWSYRVLDPEPARAFRLLGLHPGPDISLAAAAALTGVETDRAGRALDALATAHLLTEHTPGRYEFHDLLRAYARELSHEYDDEHVRRDASQRICAFYVLTAYEADNLLEPGRQPVGPTPSTTSVRPGRLADPAAAIAWFEAEHSNLLAAQSLALDLGFDSTAWQTAWALTTFHYRRGHRRTDLTVWQRALSAAERLPDPVTRSFAHRRLGVSHAALGEHEAAIGHLHELLVLSEAEGPAAQAHAHRVLAWARELQGDFERALHHATRALELYRSQNRATWEARALNDVAWYGAHLGDYDTARRHCLSSLELHKLQFNAEGEADSLDTLGYIEQQTGHHEEAVAQYRMALDLYQGIGNTNYAANTLDKLGHPLLSLGRREQARAAWQEALGLYRRQSRPRDAERVQGQLDSLGGVGDA